MSERPATIPSLYTSNMDETLKFYQENLGFSKTSERKMDGKVIWSQLKQHDTTIWFFANPLQDVPTAVFSGLIYIFINDLDKFAAYLSDTVETRWGPVTQDYGLRELGLKDNNGYFLVFAEYLL